MRKRRFFDHDPAGDGRVSAATIADLELVALELAAAEASRARAAVALARVRARGDGEAAVGMPVTQHLRWTTNVRRGTVTTLGTITDVAADLPTMISALEAGAITLDQAGAIAWPCAKTSAALRRAVDAALASPRCDGWSSLSPEALEAEVHRLLDERRPDLAEDREDDRRQRQFLHLQPTLDGQGLDGRFRAFGIDAALIDATIRNAADSPSSDVNRPGQLFGGLLRICDAWAHGRRPEATRDEGAGDHDRSNVTLYAIVDERDDACGAGEVVATSAGLAPRLTATEVARLQTAGARRVVVFAVDREVVAVQGRAGHAIHDPASLSENTTRILVTVRDATCRMPGCDRPVEHVHHLVWRGLAKARGQTAPDDPRHRAGVCQACHALIHRHHWAGRVKPGGRTPSAIVWTRAGPAGQTTTRTLGRFDRHLRPAPPQPELDHDGQPLPF